MSKLSVVILVSLFLLACERPEKRDSVNKQYAATENKNSAAVKMPLNEIEVVEKKENSILPASAFMTADWLDLLPEDDLNALSNPPSYLDEIVDGSAQDQLSNTLKNELKNDEGDRYQQALTSTQVKSVVNNAPIKIPAFIVPLEFDDKQNVTQFFMVPFFGACLHLPPPPPNQTIYVNYPKGLKLESLYDAYWISGIIKTSLVENDTAIAAYSMEMHAFELYTDEP